jgi:hypothetical protein
MPDIRIEVWIHDHEDGVWGSGHSELKMTIPVSMTDYINFQMPVMRLIEEAVLKSRKDKQEQEAKTRKAQRDMEHAAGEE